MRGKAQQCFRDTYTCGHPLVPKLVADINKELRMSSGKGALHMISPTLEYII